MISATTIKNLLHIYSNSSVENEFKIISEEINGKIAVVPDQTIAIINIFKPLTSLKFFALGENGSTYNNVSVVNPIMNKKALISKYNKK